jgi:hypothetical protein
LEEKIGLMADVQCERSSSGFYYIHIVMQKVDT